MSTGLRWMLPTPWLSVAGLALFVAALVFSPLIGRTHGDIGYPLVTAQGWALASAGWGVLLGTRLCNLAYGMIRLRLPGIPRTLARGAILNLLLASDPVEDRAATLAALEAVAQDATLPDLWRDLATLRRVIVQGTEAPLAERRAALEPLAQPGRSFRPLAAEQLAYLLVEEGKTAEAITALQALVADQEAPGGLRSRASQMIVALGGELAQG